VKKIAFSCFVVLAATLASVTYGKPPKKDDYDRLDGKGPSGKKVDVVEWEGNLELHVYPKGSLVGLGLKIDEETKGKKVMVISYRFNNAPNAPLIRRALISIPFAARFQAFKDPTADDYDKIIISNNGLSGQLLTFRLDPPPTQLYPDGHPALAQKEEVQETPPRVPASSAAAGAKKTQEADTSPAPTHYREDPTSIRAFAW
jgi:hypothetical protein